MIFFDVVCLDRCRDFFFWGDELVWEKSAKKILHEVESEIDIRMADECPLLGSKIRAFHKWIETRFQSMIGDRGNESPLLCGGLIASGHLSMYA